MNKGTIKKVASSIIVMGIVGLWAYNMLNGIEIHPVFHLVVGVLVIGAAMSLYGVNVVKEAIGSAKNLWGSK